MPLMFHNGQVLFRGGQVAMDPACCCELCCGCSWLEAYHASGGRIRVTFTGQLTGYAIMDPVATPAVGNCLEWFTSDMTNVDDTACGLFPQSAGMSCPSNNKTTAAIAFGIGTGSGTCDLSDPAVQNSFSCGPPLAAVYTHALEEIVAGGCAPCSVGGTVTMTLSNEDPWP